MTDTVSESFLKKEFWLKAIEKRTKSLEIS
jgi:hypothetical protein